MTSFRVLRASALCLSACLIVVLAGCGSSGASSDDSAATPGGPAMLDTAKIESAIEKSVLRQRGVKANVTCPVEVEQKRGIVFSCDAAVGSTTTKFTVTELDDAGHVHYEAL